MAAADGRAERREKERIARRPERLGDERLANGCTRELSALDEALRELDVLPLVVAVRLPAGLQVRGVRHRERDGHQRQQENAARHGYSPLNFCEFPMCVHTRSCAICRSCRV